jgi:protein-S-isoprenylcysteine O-methyltransferase Ste14
MNAESDEDFLSKNMPFQNVWYKVLLVVIFQLFVFVLSLAFFWWFSSLFLFGALFVQFLIILIGTTPYRLIVRNIDEIRKTYPKKYGEKAAQKLWLKYEFYTVPILSSSMYYPLLLAQYDFIPITITLPEHIITTQLMPIFISIPLGIIVIIFGYLIRSPSGGFGSDIESYFHLLYPEKGKLITKGIYQYIRNPRYLGRGFVVFGFGLVANNFLALLVALIHFIGFCFLIIPEDKELESRFGKEFIDYKKKVPALYPKRNNFKNFLKHISRKKTD